MIPGLEQHRGPGLEIGNTTRPFGREAEIKAVLPVTQHPARLPGPGIQNRSDNTTPLRSLIHRDPGFHAHGGYRKVCRSLFGSEENPSARRRVGRSEHQAVRASIPGDPERTLDLSRERSYGRLQQVPLKSRGRELPLLPRRPPFIIPGTRNAWKRPHEPCQVEAADKKAHAGDGEPERTDLSSAHHHCKPARQRIKKESTSQLTPCGSPPVTARRAQQNGPVPPAPVQSGRSGPSSDNSPPGAGPLRQRA